MEIRRGITELLEAIPDRIEVSGQSPTWRVTGGSFESVVDYARGAFDEPVVIAREDRRRWWPRVTLTVTTDPDLAAVAPPWEALTGPQPEPDPQPGPDAGPDMQPATGPDAGPDMQPASGPDAAVEDRVFVARHRADDHSFASFLDEAFARQEALRQQRARVPAQRRRSG